MKTILYMSVMIFVFAFLGSCTEESIVGTDSNKITKGKFNTTIQRPPDFTLLHENGCEVRIWTYNGTARGEWSIIRWQSLPIKAQCQQGGTSCVLWSWMEIHSIGSLVTIPDFQRKASYIGDIYENNNLELPVDPEDFDYKEIIVGPNFQFPDDTPESVKLGFEVWGNLEQ